MSLNHILELPSLQLKLRRAGYESLEALVSSNITKIITELQLNEDEQKRLNEVVNTELREQKAINQNEGLNSISTQSKSIDALFGHGIPPKKITEICGESGTGKTQLCKQLAINSILPTKQGGEPGECIYIDTEGSFSSIGTSSRLSSDSDLNRLHVFRATSYPEFMSLITELPTIVQRYPNTKLIVIDSITYHFRVNVSTKNDRDNILHYIGLSLFRIAKENNLAIVASNHVTQEEDNSAWTPSLGSSWGNWCSSRLFMYRKRNFRFAYLYKSYDPTGSQPVQFCIKNRGITDPVEDERDDQVNNEEIIKKLDQDIGTSFTQLRQDKDAEDEQHRVDVFWKGAYSKELNILEDSDLGLYSQRTVDLMQAPEIFETKDDPPTYTQNEFKPIPEEETSIIQKIETIREEEEEEDDIDVYSELSFKAEDNIFEIAAFSSQLPLDEDDGSNFLSEPQIIDDSIPYTRSDSNLSYQYPVNNQIIYEEDDDFIPATQVYEISNLMLEPQSSNGNLAYPSQEENTISFFKETDDNIDSSEVPFYSQDSGTPSLRASLGIERSITGIEFQSSLTDVRSRLSSTEKSSTPRKNSDELLLSKENSNELLLSKENSDELLLSKENSDELLLSKENLQKLLNIAKETVDDSFITEFEDFKQKVMPESEMSVPAYECLPIPLLSTEEGQQTASTSQLNQAEEFGLCPVTNTMLKTEENEESTPHCSQVNSVERHDLTVNEEEVKDVIQDNQISLTVSPLSPAEKKINARVVRFASPTRKKDRDTTDFNENVDNSPKRQKANKSPENHAISNDSKSNQDTTEEIKNVDQTQPTSSTKKRDHDITDSNEDNSPKRQKTKENYPILSNAESNNDATEGIKNVVDKTQHDNTNQTKKDTATITTVGMKDKEIVADWDSDVEEELDYKYINEMEDFL
ncbi:hypothetical protein HPULCUR_009729 [Helicostylum pulchrum]|uniref:DNA repair protein RAD51 homolog 3 n=1 Tax=Helicostylum pulchrum TaxID=562976 RepID=A0ABP9YB96_9FUNG